MCFCMTKAKTGGCNQSSTQTLPFINEMKGNQISVEITIFSIKYESFQRN